MTIPLALRLLTGSSRQPGPLGAKLPCRPPLPGAARDPYSALLPVGLAVPVLLPVPRWALTPPFHPYPAGAGRFHFCGAFRRVAPPGRYPAPSLHGVRTFLGPPTTRWTRGYGRSRSSGHPRGSADRQSRERRQSRSYSAACAVPRPVPRLEPRRRSAIAIRQSVATIPAKPRLVARSPNSALASPTPTTGSEIAT